MQQPILIAHYIQQLVVIWCCDSCHRWLSAVGVVRCKSLQLWTFQAWIVLKAALEEASFTVKRIRITAKLDIDYDIAKCGQLRSQVKHDHCISYINFGKSSSSGEAAFARTGSSDMDCDGIIQKIIDHMASEMAYICCQPQTSITASTFEPFMK